MSIDLPPPGPKLRAEAIRAAKARYERLKPGLDKDQLAEMIVKLEEIDREQTEKEMQ